MPRFDTVDVGSATLRTDLELPFARRIVLVEDSPTMSTGLPAMSPNGASSNVPAPIRIVSRVPAPFPAAPRNASERLGLTVPTQSAGLWTQKVWAEAAGTNSPIATESGTSNLRA